MKHHLRYLRGTKTYGIEHKRTGEKRLIGYNDSSHNIDPDDGKSMIGHAFYYGSSSITWCSQKQYIVALSSCEVEFMAIMTTTCQSIRLQELLSGIINKG